MQLYFDPTRKTTLKKMKNDLKKNEKWPKKNENGRRPQSYWADLTTKTSKTNGFDTIVIDLVMF